MDEHMEYNVVLYLTMLLLDGIMYRYERVLNFGGMSLTGENMKHLDRNFCNCIVRHRLLLNPGTVGEWLALEA